MKEQVLIIGDNCIDKFQYGTVTRICPEAPCPIFVPSYSTVNDGMAGNVLANLKALSSEIEIDYVTNQKPPIKTRYVDEKSNQMIVRVDEKDTVNKANIANIKFGQYNAVIISDYDKGFLDEDDLEYIAQKSHLSFLDTKKRLGYWAKDFTFIKINEKEERESANEISDFIAKDRLIVTLGDRGAKYNGEYFPSEKVNIMDISGAGDTFLAALVCKYLQTNSIEESIIFANQMAAIVVQRRGVSTI